MAPPSRRKQRPPPSSSPSSASSSSSSPIPLPGVALGLFAAIAAGFAASRALRKKRPVSLQDQAISAGKDSAIPLLVQDREIEIKEKDDSKASPLVVINGTIAISREPAKLGLKPVFEAFEEASIQKKIGANSAEEEEEEEKRAEADEEGELREGEGEPMEITIEVEASVVVDEASMEALQETSLVEEEGEEDGDDERLAEQPSPVLINGKALDFNEEMDDSEEDHDLVSNGSNSLSDVFSESSLREVSSAPVKPLPAEETPINWPETKPDFVVTEEEEEKEVLEGKNWPEMVPQMVNKLPDLKQNWPDLKQNLPDLKPVSVEKVGELLDLKPVLVEIKEEGASAEKLKQLNYEVIISGLVDVKVASAEKLIQLKEEGVSAEKLNQLNYEVISRLVDVRGNDVVLEGEVSVNVGLDERIDEAVSINDKGLSVEPAEIKTLDFPQPDERSASKAIANGEPNLHLAQEGADTDFSTNGETNLQSTQEGCDDNTGLRTNGEPNLQLAQERTAEYTGHSGTSGDPLEEPDNGDPLEEPVLQSHGQNLDSVDDTSVDNTENNLDADNLQSTQEGCDDNTGIRTYGEPNLQLAHERTTEHIGLSGTSDDPLEEPANGDPVLQSHGQNLDSVDDTSVDNIENNLDADNLQSTQDGCDDNIGLRTNCEPNLQLAQERTTEYTSLSGTSGDPLEKPANGDPLEEPVLQSHEQNLDSVDDTSVDNTENNLDADNLQSTQEGCEHNTGLRINSGEPNVQLAQEMTIEYTGLSGTSGDPLEGPANGDPLEEPANGNPLEEPVLQSHGQNLDSVDDTSVDNTENNLDSEQEQPSLPIATTEAKACEKELSSGTKDDDGPDKPRRAKGKPRIHVQQQEIEELTRSLDISEQIIESKKLESFTNTTLMHNNKADQLVSSAIAQEADLQSEGGFQSKIHKFAPYLPLEMGLICLLIGLVSFVLWYLGTSSSGQE